MKKITNSMINKIGCGATLAAFTASQFMVNPVIFAAGEGMDVAKTIIDVLAEYVPGIIGAFFLFTGVFKAILAYRQENPEAVATAAKDIAVGAILLIFGIVLWPNISPVIFK